MKKGIRFMLFFSLVLMVSVLLAACGSSNNESTSDPSQSETKGNNQQKADEPQQPQSNETNQPVAEKPNEPITLTYFYNDWSMIEYEVPLIEEKFPWITVKVTDSLAARIVPDMLNYSMGSHF